MYNMQEIASQGNIEEEALIQYIVDGVQDDEHNKAILYNSHTISQLKKNLEIYDRMKTRAQPKGRNRNSSKEGLGPMNIKETRSDAVKGRQRHCYNCGST